MPENLAAERAKSVVKSTTPAEPIRSSVNRARSTYNGSRYKFPLNLGATYMSFSFKGYSYGGSRGRSTSRNGGSVILPIPQNLLDAFTVNVGQADLGSIGAAALDVIGTAQGGGVGATLDLAERFGASSAEAITQGSASTAAGAAKYFARSAVDSVFQGAGLAIDVATGTAVNPHTTLNFDGVNLKEYNFNWQLAPRNEAESNALKDIVKKFKFHMLPAYQGLTDGSGTSLDRALLTYPDLVEIQLYGLSEDHYFRFEYPGMIKNMSVNYSSQGNVVLAGGKPAVVDIAMTFQEARIHTRDMYR